MNNADAVLRNRSLLPRTINLKRRILLAAEATRSLHRHLPPEDLQGDMAQILSQRLRQLAKRVRNVERILYLVDDQTVSASAGGRLQNLMQRSARSLAYLLPAAKSINRHLKRDGCPLCRDELERLSANLQVEVVQAEEIMSALKRDVDVLADCVKEEFPEEQEGQGSTEGGSSGTPTTRLSVAEFAGVLGVEESTLTDAVRDGSKLNGLRVDRWIQGDADFHWHFQVPNEILRDRGAEALIITEEEQGD